MRIRHVMIVDDEPDMLDACRDALSRMEGIEIVTEVESARVAGKLRGDTDWDLILVDLKMPGIDGIQLLQSIKKESPQTVVCIITGYPTIETAVESVKLGAFDYITKPFTPAQLQTVVRRALEKRMLSEENLLLVRHVEKTYKFDNIIGKSPAMRAVFDLIQQVAETPSDVLIVGESGTGKELVARSIHARSRHYRGRFVPVDCGAIPENILESELFGHVKGAYTGADSSQIGLLEFAHQGTFFLDEVCELTQALQAKLLRALQERTFRRVGSKEEIHVDLRIIAATNRDVETEVREKRFREDLYYRINVVRICISPLRERREDIPLLVQHYLARYSREFDKQAQWLDPEALEVLTRYDWPGNVRELQNILKRAIVLSRGDHVSVDDLPDDLVERAESQNGREPLGFFGHRAERVAAIERQYLTELLQRCNGDVTLSAQEAHLPRGTLYRFLKKYDIKPDTFRKV